MRLENITAVPHPLGNRIELRWNNPTPAEYPGIRVVRRESTYPMSPDDGVLVAEGSALLFSMDLSLQNDLDSGTLSTALRQKFLGNQIVLSNDAALAVDVPGSKWRISDSEIIYYLKKEGLVLNVYGEGLTSAVDENLKGELVYYYTLFLYNNGFSEFIFDNHNRVSALATSPYNLAAEMHKLLPGIYHRYDTILPKTIPDGMSENDSQEGQLRRLLDLPGGELDLIYSFARTMLDLHNLEKVDGRLLPLLGKWIGWPINFSLELSAQRNEVKQAPEIYKTVGILANLRAFVNRLTNWDSQIKEFVHNVFVANDPERLTLWLQKLVNVGWSDAELVSVDFAYEGAPASFVDAHGRLWLIYHAQRGDKSDIYYKIYDQGSWSPGYRITLSDSIDKYPTGLQTDDGHIWLFWSSYENETWNIKTRVLSVGRDLGSANLINNSSEPYQLTDGSTLVVSIDGGKLATAQFWDADFIDINNATTAEVIAVLERDLPDLTASATGNNIQLTSNTIGEGSSLLIDLNASTSAASLGFGTGFPNVTQSEMEPNAFLDSDGKIWLFWSSRREGKWQIWYNVFDGASWDTAKRLTTDAIADRQPVSVFFDAAEPNRKIWVFWSRKGPDGWNIYYQTKPSTDFNDTTWNPEIELSPIPSGQKYENKDPAVKLDQQGNILVFWSSNRTGNWNIWYKDFDKGLDDWTAEVAATTDHFTKKGPTILQNADGETWLLYRSNKSLSYNSGIYPSTISYDDRYSGSIVIDDFNRDRIGSHAKLDDILAYSYDTGKEITDWYARDTVGIFLTPDTEDQKLITRNQEVVKGILNRFLPIQLRVVFVINPVVYKENIYTYEDASADPQRFIEEVFLDSTIPETYKGLSDQFEDDMVEWLAMYSWSAQFPNHHTVDFTTIPILTTFRSWHTDLVEGG